MTEFYDTKLQEVRVEEQEVLSQIEELERKLAKLQVKESRLAKERSEEVKIGEVNDYFDNFKSKLEIYQEVCKNLLGEVPDSVSKCEELLKGVYINIFDYVEGNYDKTFENLSELRKYCRKGNPGFFPKERAKSENLRCLLKKLFY